MTRRNTIVKKSCQAVLKAAASIGYSGNLPAKLGAMADDTTRRETVLACPLESNLPPAEAAGRGFTAQAGRLPPVGSSTPLASPLESE